MPSRDLPPPPPPSVTPPRRSFWKRQVGIVVLAIVALVGLGAILSALEEPTGETAASPTDVPSLVTSGTPTATTPTPSVERVAGPRVVGIRLENAKDVLKETELQVNVVRKYSTEAVGDGALAECQLRGRGAPWSNNPPGRLEGSEASAFAAAKLHVWLLTMPRLSRWG